MITPMIVKLGPNPRSEFYSSSRMVGTINSYHYLLLFTVEINIGCRRWEGEQFKLNRTATNHRYSLSELPLIVQAYGQFDAKVQKTLPYDGTFSATIRPGSKDPIFLLIYNEIKFLANNISNFNFTFMVRDGYNPLYDFVMTRA
jgi:hypothetical protein